MLVRTQILLEEKQKLELQKLAEMAGVSMSKMARNTIAHGVKVEKKQVKKATKKTTGVEFLTWLSEHPVHGPGDSEYDKYAYDL